MNDDYSRFRLPAVRGMDDSVGHEGGGTPEGVCELAPFLYQGSLPWPFKYQVQESQTASAARQLGHPKDVSLN